MAGHHLLTIPWMAQGFGGPCCARILTSWFATKERGTYWGMWNIAHNLGGFSAPLLAGTAARSFGWKWGATPGCSASPAVLLTSAQPCHSSARQAGKNKHNATHLVAVSTTNSMHGKSCHVIQSCMHGQPTISDGQTPGCVPCKGGP